MAQKDDNTSKVLPPDPHAELAREQAAHHRSCLAVTRWRSGATPAEWDMAQALQPDMRAQWQARLQEQFIAWLDAGGFSRQANTLATTAPETRATIAE